MRDWAQYIRENEDLAITEIYAEYRDSFVNWIQGKSRYSQDEAIELFQNSIVILYENVISGKITDLKNPKSYLYSIGKNKLYELYRAKKRNSTESLSEVKYLNLIIEEEFNIDPKNDVLNLLHKSIEELGDPCKTLLIDFYFKRKSLEEISEDMNYKNSNTVKTKKFKCIKRLRKLMNDKNIWDEQG